jgi:uncharacterized protein YgiM (DUF1202 family)
MTTVYVKATALNVRDGGSPDAAILTTVQRGEKLTVLSDAGDWLQVELANGKRGWVSAQHVQAEGLRPVSKRRRPGCPADSDFAFVKTPTLSFSDTPRPGLVVIDATVNAKGDVVSTKVVSNSTGDASLASLAEREIRAAKFSAPVRDCVPRTFVYTYKRTF